MFSELLTDETLDEQQLVERTVACGCKERIPPEQDPQAVICRQCEALKALAS